MKTDIDVPWAGLSVGEGLQVLKRDFFSSPLPCQYRVLDSARREAGSLLYRRNSPDLLSWPLVGILSPILLVSKACLRRAFIATLSCIVPSIFFFCSEAKWLGVQSQAHLSPLYRCSDSGCGSIEMYPVPKQNLPLSDFPPFSYLGPWGSLTKTHQGLKAELCLQETEFHDLPGQGQFL